MSPSSTPPDVCSFCDRVGLPILPVRFAIARADLGSAPPLPAPFDADVASVGLPADLVRYTLRLLRAGYLYVFDEHRNEWSAYVVNEQSYLFSFDVFAKSPPPIVATKTFSKACKAKSDPYKARCIAIKDAVYATRVWLGFSSVPWTATVLRRHASPEYREAHMQCIDVKSWREGGHPAHMAGFDALDHVAEFAVDATALRKETRAHLQQFLPLPYQCPEDLIEANPRCQQVLATMAPKMQQWLVSALNTAVTSGTVNSAAWDFSPQPFSLASQEKDALTVWGESACKPWPAALAGVQDPVGITMELNGLAIQRCVEFTEHAERKWHVATTSAIEAIHKAVLNGAMVGQAAKQQTAAAVALPFVPSVLIRNSGNLSAMNRNLEQAGVVRSADKTRLDADTWPRYASMLDQDSLGKESAQYRDDLLKLDRDVIAPLDHAYIAWMKSKALAQHFAHNFDQADANNGAIYQQVVHGCIEQASGRTGSARYFKDCLTEDPVTSSNVVLRALIFNQQRLAAAWAEAAVRRGGAHDMTFDEGIGKFYEAVKDTFVVSSLGRDIKGPFANLSKYLYQLAGPITERLGTALNEVAEIGLAKLPERRLMTLMLGVLQAENPNLELVDVRGVQSPRQAAKALAQAIAARSGGGAQNLYGSVEALIIEAKGKESALFRGLFLIDRARLKTMQGANNAARLTTVKPETFERLLETSSRGLFNAEVKAGVIGAILNAATLGASYRELIRSDGKGPGSLNFASGVASLIGSSMETTGRMVEKMPWAESPISLAMRNLGLVQEFNAKWLVGTGQWVGIIGGVLAAALQMWEGTEEYEYNHSLGFTMLVLGVAEIAAAFMVLSAWTGVGLVIGLLVMAAIWAVGQFKTDDIQKWLAKSKFGSLENGRDRFHSLMEQQAALAKLAAG